MKVLVTGGAGFIGSHLCALLLDDGHAVVCADNLLTGSETNIAPLLSRPGFRFERTDVTESYETDADAIFHLASPASPVAYARYPFETIRANTTGTMRLLESAKRSGARFLMASTSEIYGDPLVHPQTETYNGNVSPTGPRACYDESKRLGETITAEYHRQYGVDTRIVRIFNTYGPRISPNDGRMVPNFIVQALSGRPLTIYGDGQQTRSICYVDDLIRGLCLAMFQPRTSGEIFNLGNPAERSVLEWAQLITRLCHSESEVLFEAKRTDDPDRRKPNIEKARTMLGWSPVVEPKDGLCSTIAWFRAESELHNLNVPVAL